VAGSPSSPRVRKRPRLAWRGRLKAGDVAWVVGRWPGEAKNLVKGVVHALFYKFVDMLDVNFDRIVEEGVYTGLKSTKCVVWYFLVKRFSARVFDRLLEEFFEVYSGGSPGLVEWSLRRIERRLAERLVLGEGVVWEFYRATLEAARASERVKSILREALGAVERGEKSYP